MKDAIRVNSTAYAASLIVNKGYCEVLAVFGYNSGGTQFIQLHDAAAVPSEGAVPAVIITVPTGNFSIDLPLVGVPFNTGCVVCNSSTGPTKTIGGADCYFSAVVRRGN